MKSWAVHACKFSKTCRETDAPNRVHLRTPWFLLGVALSKDARYGDYDLVDGRPVLSSLRFRWYSFDRR